ncbi:hypothetical protein HMPREF1640_05310 [Prevotella sp. S7-1-8]|jgi:hypothetical protein|uniref:DUF5056 domain-containing protein n=1 Tax=Prevotella sp. S7-1-8 TaxID=1284775 RepID=UPI00051078F9|nr:DUF5056 domain-containing protein [Prevotella sp. S7-1-8]KGF17952.1 hypothetical protein HMPREF1640_05310 [Prevotella sp. S7-1-8]
MRNDNEIKTDDQLLEQFFSSFKRDIPDDGFSHKVMRRLPLRAKRVNAAWSIFCLMVGVALFIVFNGLGDLRAIASNFVGDVIGYVASIHLSLFSLVWLWATMALLALVGFYNVSVTQR